MFFASPIPGVRVKPAEAFPARQSALSRYELLLEN
jgi:hypothetical protein